MGLANIALYLMKCHLAEQTSGQMRVDDVAGDMWQAVARRRCGTTRRARRVGSWPGTPRQGLTLVHVRAQLEQLQDNSRVKVGHTVDRRAQLELK